MAHKEFLHRWRYSSDHAGSGCCKASTMDAEKCRKVWSTREIEFWNQFRYYGWFANLTDDLFRLVVAHAVRTL